MKVLMTAFLFLSFFGQDLMAQIKYGIDYDAEKEEYVLYLVSDKEMLSAPYNRISTAQITIKTETGKLNPVSITNLQNGAEWELNSVHESPEEAPEFDYFSFGLNTIGTDAISFEKEEQIPLLSFKNSKSCVGIFVSLVDNKDDKFHFPNSCKANIANHIAVLGILTNNAYVGNVGQGSISCSGEQTTTGVEELGSSFQVSPNPAPGWSEIKIDWTRDATPTEIILVDALGKIHKPMKIDLLKGRNKIPLDLQDLPSGVYFVKLRMYDREVTLEKLINVQR